MFEVAAGGGPWPDLPTNVWGLSFLELETGLGVRKYQSRSIIPPLFPFHYILPFRKLFGAPLPMKRLFIIFIVPVGLALGLEGQAGSSHVNGKVAFSCGSYNLRSHEALKIFLRMFAWGLGLSSAHSQLISLKLCGWQIHYLLRMLNLHIPQSVCLKMYFVASPPLGLVSDIFTNSFCYAAFPSTCSQHWTSTLI